MSAGSGDSSDLSACAGSTRTLVSVQIKKANETTCQTRSEPNWWFPGRRPAGQAAGRPAHRRWQVQGAARMRLRAHPLSSHWVEAARRPPWQPSPGRMTATRPPASARKATPLQPPLLARPSRPCGCWLLLCVASSDREAVGVRLRARCLLASVAKQIRPARTWSAARKKTTSCCGRLRAGRDPRLAC
jgi:hypothetical protein